MRESKFSGGAVKNEIVGNKGLTKELHKPTIRKVHTFF